ncbi:MAG: hypothetical protein MJ180_06065, partial [Candidatus Gastranaerophilales bacterium]|nr:hypothetical protein [Candidatus Gastranaerophilales bacterium]
MQVSSVSQKYNVANFGINLTIPRASRLLLHKSGANNDSINVFIKYAKTLEPKRLKLTLSRGRKPVLLDSELPAYDFLKFVT